MGRTKDLSDNEKTRIEAYAELGHTVTAIATRLGRHKSTISRFLHPGVNQRCRSNSGRKPVLTIRDRRRIIQLATHDQMSSSRIRTTLGVPVHRSTVYRVLSSDKNVRYAKRKLMPRLQPKHIVARREFSHRYQTWDNEWKNIVFSDEKKFNLDGPDGCQYYWHDLRKEPKWFSKRVTGGGSVKYWGAFGYNGKSDLVEIVGRNNSDMYQRIVGSQLEAHFRRIGGPDAVFQQDNATFHTSASTIAFFQEQGVPLFDWPALSPDLNPIENLWGHLVKQIYANGRQYDHLSDLKEAVQQAWTNIPLSYLQQLINSMKDRVYDLIQKKGRKTRF